MELIAVHPPLTTNDMGRTTTGLHK